MYLEDLKPSNIQDANEAGPLALGAVQGLVDPHHHPLEQTLVQGLGDGLHCKLNLVWEVQRIMMRNANIVNLKQIANKYL